MQTLSKMAKGLLTLGLSVLLFSSSLQAKERFEGITLTHFMQAGATDRLEGYKKLASEFKASTGATVQFVGAPWGQMQGKILNDFIAQTGVYDTMELDDTAWGPNLSQFLEVLDDRVANSKIDMSDYEGINSLVGYSVGRKERYAMPLTGRSMVAYYRKDVLDAAGITPPKTWKEMIAVAKALHSEKMYGISVAGVNVQLNKYFYGALKGNPENMLFDAAGKPLFNGPTGIQALDTLKELFQYTPPGVYAMDNSEADQVFLNGDAALLIAWPDYIQPSLDDPEKSKIVGKWSALVPPGPGNFAAWSLGLSPYSKNKDAAWAWLEMVTSAENSKKLMLDYGVYSIRTSVLRTPEVLNSFPGIGTVLAASKESFNASFFGHPKAVDWFVQSGAIWSAALNNQISSEEAVLQAADLWNKLFKEGEGPAGFSYQEVQAN